MGSLRALPRSRAPYLDEWLRLSQFDPMRTAAADVAGQAGRSRRARTISSATASCSKPTTGQRAVARLWRPRGKDRGGQTSVGKPGRRGVVSPAERVRIVPRARRAPRVDRLMPLRICPLRTAARGSAAEATRLDVTAGSPSCAQVRHAKPAPRIARKGVVRRSRRMLTDYGVGGSCAKSSQAAGERELVETTYGAQVWAEATTEDR